jgi:uncharacterized membrane protein
MEYIGHFLLVGALFAAIDAVWLGVVANKFYKSRMGALLMDKPSFAPAVIFYVIYVIGILVFALEPALRDGEVTTALGMGAMFGFAAYATYDLTNASTLKGWSTAVTVVDLIWGTTVTMLTTVIAFLILS